MSKNVQWETRITEAASSRRKGGKLRQKKTVHAGDAGGKQICCDFTFTENKSGMFKC